MPRREVKQHHACLVAGSLACARDHIEHVIASPEQSQIRLIMLFGAIMRHFVKAPLSRSEVKQHHACLMVSPHDVACGHGEHVIASPEQSHIRLTILIGAIMRHSIEARFVKN